MNRRVKLFIPARAVPDDGRAFCNVWTEPVTRMLCRQPLVDKPLPEFSSAQPLCRGRSRFPESGCGLGEILIVNIWGSWCLPCHIEHPFLLEMSEAKPDPSLTFVGISYDDSMAEDRLFLEERGNPFDSQCRGSGRLPKRIDLGVTGAPETFLVDAQRHDSIPAYRCYRQQQCGKTRLNLCWNRLGHRYTVQGARYKVQA